MDSTLVTHTPIYYKFKRGEGHSLGDLSYRGVGKFMGGGGRQGYPRSDTPYRCPRPG